MTSAGTTGAPVSLAGAVRAEALKFRTLPSPPITVTAAALLIAVLGAVLVWARSAQGEPAVPTQLLTGVSWAQLLIAVLAVVTVCTEWTSGTSLTTFLAVPRRWPVLVAKALVTGASAFLAGTIGALGALAAGIAGGIGPQTDPALFVRLVVGTGLYLAAIAMLALAIGALVRDLVGGILTAVGFLWLLPLLAGMIPLPEAQRLVAFLPTPAGSLLLAAESSAAPLSPWAGFAVLAGWACLALVAAVVVLRRRDV